MTYAIQKYCLIEDGYKTLEEVYKTLTEQGYRQISEDIWEHPETGVECVILEGFKDE